MAYNISVSATNPYIDVYQSKKTANAGEQVIVFARPYRGYTFEKWSDDNTENPRTITVNSDIALVASYTNNSGNDVTNSYRVFIKDQLNLNDPPKAFFKTDAFHTKNDLLTTANSEIEVTEKVENVENGDIIVVYDPYGTRIYQGVITSIEEKSIRASQMQHYYSDEWIYEKGETPPTTYDGSWEMKRYDAMDVTPHIEDFEGKTPTATQTFLDSNLSTSLNVANNYTAKCVTYVWCSKPFISQITLITDDQGSIYLNGKLLGETTTANDPYSSTVEFSKGRNDLVVCYREGTGSDGWRVTYSPDAFEKYAESKTYEVGDYVNYNDAVYYCTTAISTPERWTASHWTANTTPRLTVKSEVLGLNSTLDEGRYLEDEIKNILEDYSDGKLVGSDYVDPLVAQRFNSIDVVSIPTTTARLTTQQVGETMDFEDFIYMLYDKYGIIFDFNIQFEGSNSVTIKVPDYQSIKISNNTYAIKDMSPITKIEEKNRLVIFDKNMKYRATYVATKDDVVKEPVSTVNRFDITNSVIVTSDDDEADLIAANLPTNMYNHKLSFTLVLKNFVYSLGEFKLGMPLEVWYNNDYYSTVLTGIEMQKDSNKEISEVRFTCGLVRQKLTQLLTLGKTR